MRRHDGARGGGRKIDTAREALLVKSAASSRLAELSPAALE